MVTGHDAFELFFEQGGQRESHTWATVKAVNSDGTADVMLNPSTATRASCLCSVKTGDRVLVLVFNQGAVILGKAV